MEPAVVHPAIRALRTALSRRRHPAPGELADPDHGIPAPGLPGADGTVDDTDQGWDFTPPATDVHSQES